MLWLWFWSWFCGVLVIVLSYFGCGLIMASFVFSIVMQIHKQRMGQFIRPINFEA